MTRKLIKIIEFDNTPSTKNNLKNLNTIINDLELEIWKEMVLKLGTLICYKEAILLKGAVMPSLFSKFFLLPSSINAYAYMAVQ